MSDQSDAQRPNATVIVCDTCAAAPDQKYIGERTGGEVFAAAVEAAAATDDAVTVRRFSCLMNCSRHCSAALTSPGKTTYVLGDFAPSPEDAAGLVAYARLYAESETGTVPYRQWPAEVKGHFVSRTPGPALLDQAEKK